MRLQAISALALSLLLAACSPQGDDYTIRVELWAQWVESDDAPGACEGGEGFNAEFYDSEAEVALLNTDGGSVSRTTFGGGYIDRSLVARSGAKPSRVCVWELRFRNVPELKRYRFLWPNGETSVSHTPAGLVGLVLVADAGWTPDRE